MDIEKSLEKLILDLFDVKGVKFGSFKLKNGMISPIYIDLRVIVSFPKLLNSLTDILVHEVQNSDLEQFDHICGVPYTALPIATLVSAKTGVSMLIRRKESKDYGTKKIIEGVFQKGDKCIIIEDVVTSGLSILETMADLEKEGLRVTSAVLVLDRDQGGLKNLRERGLKVHELTSVTNLLKTLLKHGKITEQMVKEVENFIASNRATIDNHDFPKAKGNIRLMMPFTERAKVTKNEFTAKIFQLMELKETNLCVAADVTKASDLLKLASQVGSHICIFKTHFDAVEDFTRDTYLELLNIAKNLNFLIMEDRKFSDIGNTVYLQYNQIKHWASLVTAHSIAGEGILSALKSGAGNKPDKGCFLVAELSCEGHLMNKEYTQETLSMAEKHLDFVVGLVCQSPDVIKVPYLIQLTPGVKIEETSDNLGQKYDDPDYVVLEKGADIAVVGRGIISSSNPEKTALNYKKKLWNAYVKRINRCN